MSLLSVLAIVISTVSLLVAALAVWASSWPRSYIPIEARVVHAAKRMGDRDYRAHIELEIQQQRGAVVVTHRDATRNRTMFSAYPVRTQKEKN